MLINKIDIRSKLKNYNIYFADNCDFLKQFCDKPNIIFIIDDNVWQNHKFGCLRVLDNQDIILLPVSEERKCLRTVEELYDKVMTRAPKKNLKIVSIGGGITQDITGFLVSTLYRGVEWVFIPTTLLAQSDSCIGSKTSLNYKKYKNLIGTFYPPNEIYHYAKFLKTQFQSDFCSGLGEVAKLHIMGGKDKAQRFIMNMDDIIKQEPDALTKAIKLSLTVKKSYIENDEFDQGRRNLLNYGHCFGHAIETATNFIIPHGQAVLLGMILANMVAVNRKVLSSKEAAFLQNNMLNPILKVKLSELSLNSSAVVAAMKQDKKRTGDALALIMLQDDYNLIKVNDLSTEEARNALEKLES